MGQSKAKTVPASDEELAKKPMPEPQVIRRRCQDVFWLILFVLFACGMIGMGIYAFMKGDVNRLRYGTDELGNLCGVDNRPVTTFDHTANPKLHFGIFLDDFNDPIKLCVSNCPVQNDVVCKYGIPVPTDEQDQADKILNGNCSLTLWNTRSALNRCLPTNVPNVITTAFNNTISSDDNSTLTQVARFVSEDLDGREFLATVYESVVETWQIILASVGVAVVIAFLWLVLANLVTGLTVFFTVILALAATGVPAGFLLYNYYTVTIRQQEQVLSGIDLVDSNMANKDAVLGVGITCAILFVIIFILVVALRNRIRLAVNLMKEANNAVRSMPTLIFLPIVQSISLIILSAAILVVLIFLSTSGTVVSESLSSTVINEFNLTDETTKKVLQPDRVLRYMNIYYIFGFFWCWNLITAVWQTTIAGAIASWYWKMDKSTAPVRPVISAFTRVIFYHLGSLALGSLLIALLQTIRYLLMKLQYQLKKSPNKYLQWILTAVNCCLTCVIKVVKYINKNAYIEIAVYGYSFCRAAKTAFELLVRNAVRVVVLDGMTAFILFLGKVFIVGATTTAAYFWMQHVGIVDSESSYIVPLAFIAVFAWTVSALFMTVVDTAISTIFLCFCEDIERNDGSANRPYFMPKGLKAFTDPRKNELSDMQQMKEVKS